MFSSESDKSSLFAFSNYNKSKIAFEIFLKNMNAIKNEICEYFNAIDNNIFIIFDSIFTIVNSNLIFNDFKTVGFFLFDWNTKKIIKINRETSFKKKTKKFVDAFVRKTWKIYSNQI